MDKIAGTIVFRRYRGTYLFLLLRKKGMWDIPKGHANKGEACKRVAFRELREETGLKGKDLCCIYSSIKFNTKKKYRFYLAETNKSNISLSSEHTEYCWAIGEEAIRMVNTKFKDIMASAYAEIRIHDIAIHKLGSIK